VAVSVPLKRSVGLHFVRDYAADSRGGLYLRVLRGSEGLFPNVVSCGFALHPNKEGTPYGAARYSQQEILSVLPDVATSVRAFLGGDNKVATQSPWFWFCVSDDYY